MVEILNLRMEQPTGTMTSSIVACDVIKKINDFQLHSS